MYHWFFLLEITMVKIMNNLNVCSAHSSLYPRSRFKQSDYLTKYLPAKDMQSVTMLPWGTRKQCPC
jgi:endonuclease/exonuclease/phosphatase family metal-dependent hydrolase